MAWWDKAGLGPRLVRPAQVYPMATTPMFTAVGDIFLTSIEGEVVVDAIDGGAGNGSIETGLGDIASAVAIANDAVGVRYTVLTAGGVMNKAGAPVGNLTQPILIPSGETIDFTVSAGTTSTGQVLWAIHYLPAEDGAYVTLV